jgi:hypothetical protein
MAACFSTLLPCGIRIVTGTPARRPASATDWPWLPRVAATTPLTSGPARFSQSM